MEIVNDSTLATPESGRMTLFEINFEMGLCYVITVLVLSIVGVFGNLFILYVMKKDKIINKDARAFIINMAIADLCVTGIADPMCIAGAFLGMDYLHGEAWFCVAVASICLTACICVYLNIVCLTVNRWVFICYDNLYRKIYNKFTTLLICVVTWLVGFGAELPNYFGLGGHYFDEKAHQCIWDRTANRGYTLFVSLGLIGSPVLLLVYCNTAVLVKIWKARREVLKFSSGTTYTLKTSISSAKILLTIFVVFVVCWAPYITVLVADTDDSFSMEVYLFTTILAHAHSSAPCIIYLSFKKSYRDLLRNLFRCRNRVQPIMSSSNNLTKSNVCKVMSTKI